MSAREDLIATIRQKIDASKKTLIYFDDDVDGLSSYSLIKRICAKEKGIIIKSTPVLREQYAQVYESYSPDLVIVLDKPMLDAGFADAISVPLIWIDHHDSQASFASNRKHIIYFNPHDYEKDDNRCTSYWAYQVAKEDEWLCVLGSVSDWQLNEVTKKFADQNPALLDGTFTNPADALFNSQIGKYVKLLTFNLKGNTDDVKKSIFAFGRINGLSELDDHTNKDASFLHERYDQVAGEYESLLQAAKRKAEKAKRLVLFEYNPKIVSVTSELSNQLLYLYPQKIILIARLKSDEFKCSLRCGEGYNLPQLVQNAIQGLKGYGGGHTHACGACVHKDDFQLFLTRLEKQIEEQKN